MEPPQTNAAAIMLVVVTVCVCTFIGVLTESLCVFFKIPDMGGAISPGFTHVVDTLIGALIGMLITTRAQEQRKPEMPATGAPTGTPSDPLSTLVANKPSDPVPTTEAKP